ncbi:MAG: AEC family transporter [Candidatus Komeilibacteria bacterium]|jgi:predicted permease|nr:AEC family transporter [Candidatus Komeilibacteria bacterium]MBT4447125.1 AEC family transporter [Candidatus Komeilibacteria bacterium]
MFEIFIVIVPLFLIIFASVIIQGWYNLDEHWPRVLNSFALNIGLPALIFTSLAKVSLSGQSNIILINSLFLLSSFALIYILGKILNLKQKVVKTLFICLAFGNIAYLGIPVLAQIYGPKILPDASLIIGVHLFWLFTVGLGFLDYTVTSRQSWIGKLLRKKKKQDIIKHIGLDLIKNPLLVAVILGLLVAIIDINIPRILKTSLDMLAGSVTPIVLVVIGLFIGKSKIGKIEEWRLAITFTVITLFISPGAFYLALKIFATDLDKYIPSMIMVAMPLAITPFALADKFGLDKQFIARAIVLSTTLSIITIPLWASAL